MTDIKALLREAAEEIRASVEAEYGHRLQYPSYRLKYDAGMELPVQLEAAAEALHTTGTAGDSDQDTVQFTAYLEDLLEAEREKVRVLREAMSRIIKEASSAAESFVITDAALRNTEDAK